MTMMQGRSLIRSLCEDVLCCGTCRAGVTGVTFTVLPTDARPMLAPADPEGD